MSSFNMNDELFFKSKYIKYKNKYINLKIEQEGGVMFDKDTSIIFYQKSILPKMEELKKKFKAAESSTTDTYEFIDENGKLKKIKIEDFLKLIVNIPLSDVNGLGNIFEYNLQSKEIAPRLLLNLQLQTLLLNNIDKSNQIKLEELGFPEKNFNIISKNVSGLIDKYNKTKIILGSAFTNINPITSDNLKSKADILINLINNTSSIDRISIFTEIKKKFFDPFAVSINIKLLPQPFLKTYKIDNQNNNQIKFDKVDAYIIVKKFKIDQNKGLSFQIISVGSDITEQNIITQPENIEENDITQPENTEDGEN